MRKLNSKESKEYIKEFIETRIVQWKRDFSKERYNHNREFFSEYQKEYRLKNLEKVRKRERDAWRRRKLEK